MFSIDFAILNARLCRTNMIISKMIFIHARCCLYELSSHCQSYVADDYSISLMDQCKPCSIMNRYCSYHPLILIYILDRI